MPPAVADTSAGLPGSTAAAVPRAVVAWLLVCCAMVFVMVVLGGVTRLTESGLSMVHWRPVTGLLPPTSEAQWEAAFGAYREYPEYRLKNLGMDLDGFKSIFWLEYLHRLWGRLIGLVFFLPLVWFWSRGRLSPPLARALLAIFILGGAQGLMGWVMVKSGLVERPDVSHYRLAAHLLLAVLVYGLLLRLALRLGLQRPGIEGEVAGPPRLRGHAVVMLVLLVVTLCYGAFVAGLDAGRVYNTFPLMDGRLVPGGMLALSPALSNLTENIVTVQFLHRVLATAVLAVGVALWWRARTHPAGRLRLFAHLMLVALALQFALGVATLLLAVPVALGAAHQAGALVLLSALLLLQHGLRDPGAR